MGSEIHYEAFGKTMNNVAHIALTQDKYAIVDIEDFEFLNQWKWRVRGKSSFYAIRTFRSNGKDSTLGIHRAIAERMGLDLSQDIDHKNGDPLDNRRSNLRSCTRQQGQYNRKTFVSNKIGFKGVYKHRSKFRAQIRVNGKKLDLGIFETPEKAHEAYKEAAIKYHQEFMRR